MIRILSFMICKNKLHEPEPSFSLSKEVLSVNKEEAISQLTDCTGHSALRRIACVSPHCTRRWCRSDRTSPSQRNRRISYSKDGLLMLKAKMCYVMPILLSSYDDYTSRDPKRKLVGLKICIKFLRRVIHASALRTKWRRKAEEEKNEHSQHSHLLQRMIARNGNVFGTKDKGMSTCSNALLSC